MNDWFLLFRPWSYTATLVPFLVGGVLAMGFAHGGDMRWCMLARWMPGLLSGLLFQAATNLLNTWGDERSGVDSVPGAIRTTPQVHEGKVSMRALFAVAEACLAAAVLIGVALCFYEMPQEYCEKFAELGIPSGNAGWRFSGVLLGAGIVGAMGAANYSTGVRFKYHGLGVPFVSFLMGPLETFVAFAVTSPWMFEMASGNALSTVLSLSLFFLVVSAPVALLVGVIMHGNDMRDIPTDRAAGIVTMASWMGPRRALGYYRFCHIFPYALPVILLLAVSFYDPLHAGEFVPFLLPLLALPLSIQTVRTAARVYHENPEMPKWRGLERASGLVHLVFGVLYAAALRILLT